jgi:hypothetical protein
MGKVIREESRIRGVNMIKGWCGKSCSDCKTGCGLDNTIPCSPDCENLTEEGKIIISGCLASGCEEVKYIFDMIGCSDEEVLYEYGDIAPYPYDI